MTVDELSILDFEGFVPLRSLPHGCSGVPESGGVYSVVSIEPRPNFEEKSVGGNFKGKDPSVSLEKLNAKWVPATEILYFGRAKSLRRRLDQLGLPRLWLTPDV